jgi:hypothetical protein
MEDVGIFYGHFFYFTALRHTYFVAIGYILWSFGLFYVFCISPPPFWYVIPRKSGNTDLTAFLPRL